MGIETTNAEHAMYNILYCNEKIEELKNANACDGPVNMSKGPIADNCELIRILSEYRTLLIEEMRKTPLEVFRVNDNQ